MKRDCLCARARHDHGTRAAYVIDKCHCFACRVAYANSTRVYRAGGSWHEDRLVDATGTVRRLQALSAIGVGNRVVGEFLGITPDAISKIRTSTNRVSVGTAARVAAAYDELWDKPRTDRAGQRVRLYAAAMGWLPPLAYDDAEMDKTEIDVPNAMHAVGKGNKDTILPEEIGPIIDEIAIQEAIAGRRVALTRAELAAAAAILDDMGRSAEFIADRLGVTPRTVVRMRGRRAA